MMDKEMQILEKMIGRVLNNGYADITFYLGNKQLSPEAVAAYDGYFPVIACQYGTLGIPGFKNFRVDNGNTGRCTQKSFDIDDTPLVVIAMGVDYIFETLLKISENIKGRTKCIDISLISPPMDIISFWSCYMGNDIRPVNELLENFASQMQNIMNQAK